MVISYKPQFLAGHGVWGLCYVFQNNLLRNPWLMADSAVPSYLSVPKVLEPDQAATSARAKNKKGPKLEEHVQLFHMKRDRNKGFYSEKFKLEASISLCFESAGLSCA